MPAAPKLRAATKLRPSANLPDAMNGVLSSSCLARLFRTAKGVSMVLIERQQGLETTQMRTTYSMPAGTAFIKFDNVKVPVENPFGVEDQVFRVIMTNTNHEPWMITKFSVRSSRSVVEECLKWANHRNVFEKKLIKEPVIRQKYVVLPLWPCGCER
jgi:alkylation response protein AidB-like acyl-CoA dehydrogenase